MSEKKEGWYFFNYQAKYWDGVRWRKFKWNEEPGIYEFENGSGEWNGVAWTKVTYIDENGKNVNWATNTSLRNIENHLTVEEDVILPDFMIRDIQKLNMYNMKVAKSQVKFGSISYKIRKFISQSLGILSILSLFSILFDPAGWLSAVGSFIFLFVLARIIEPKIYL